MELSVLRLEQQRHRAMLREVVVRLVARDERARYRRQLTQHHYLGYLGALPKIGETSCYVATGHGQWLAQLSVSAAALECGVRDRWTRLCAG